MFCIMGYESTMMDRVQNLLIFRKTIGRFPLKPSRPTGSFPESEIQEGFYEAWKPHERQLGIHPGASGYTYEAIRNNAFIDYDTSELVGYMQERAAAAKKEEASGKKPSE
jgi:hypothetical protein